MKRTKPVKAWAIITKHGIICDTTRGLCVYASRKTAEAWKEEENERIVRVEIKIMEIE